MVGKSCLESCRGQVTGVTVSYEGEISPNHDCRMLQAAVLAGLLGASEHSEREPDQRSGAKRERWHAPRVERGAATEQS